MGEKEKRNKKGKKGEKVIVKKRKNILILFPCLMQALMTAKNWEDFFFKSRGGGHYSVWP